MAALVRHFGDIEDAARGCGCCDVCDPAGAELRQFRHASRAERELVQQIIDELRDVDYRATGTLQRAFDQGGRLTRKEFDALLDAMVRIGLIEIEESEFEKDGDVIRFRKVRITEEGCGVRATTPLALLLSDGLVEGIAGHASTPARKRKSPSKSAAKAVPEPIELSAADEALAAKLRELGFEPE